MGPSPALLLDYDTGIKKKASPVTTDTEISLLQRLQYDFNGGGDLLVYCLFEFQLPVLFTEFSNILLGI